MNLVTSCLTKAVIGLIPFAISSSVFAVQPATVAVFVDRNGQNQTISHLFKQTWIILDGEFDVRFTTPRMVKVGEVYNDEDVDLVIAVGKRGANIIRNHTSEAKPTIVLKNEEDRSSTLSLHNVTGMTRDEGESSQSFIKRVVVALREKLRNR